MNPLVNNSRLPPAGQNNFWYEHTESKLVVVFVHGILSDSRGCWLRNDSNGTPVCYWPHLIHSDVRFQSEPLSIYMSGFHTAIDAGQFGLMDCVEQAFDALKRPIHSAQGVIPAPIDKPQILFVCHSTGGIVVRQMLVSHLEEFRDKKIGLMLYASPTFGTPFANKLGWLIRIFGNELGRHLKYMNSDLMRLHDDFKNLTQNQRLQLVGKEAVENHFILQSKLPCINNKQLVNKFTGAVYFADPRRLEKTDHFTAVKPDSPDHISHLVFCDFWEKNFRPNPQDTQEIQERKSKPSDMQIRKGLEQEMAELQKLVSQPWIKQRLAIDLTIQGLSRSKATATFRGHFVVTNLSTSEVKFTFATQIDASPSHKKQITGRLDVRDESTGEHVTTHKYKYETGDDPRGLQRFHQQDFSLPAGAAYTFEWSTSEYTIDLPYCEFWATAHPVLGMKISIDSGEAQLSVIADCYRRLADPGMFRTWKDGSQHKFEALGPFLPYQGMFVRVDQR